MSTFESYPTELRERERAALNVRRTAAGLPPLDANGADDTVGLCLSGGGVRSATFCLGFLQAMACRGLVRQIDWMSTVSGGGYIGTFLGRFFDRLRSMNPPLPRDTVERALSNSSSREIRWLRRHGEYLAPAGRSDLLYDFAIFLRNFLTVHLLLGTLLFGLYCLANLVRYGLLEGVANTLPYVGGLSWRDLPLGYLVSKADLGVFWSPWFMLVELFLLLAVVPHGIGYWLASQDEVEAFSKPTLILVFAAIVGLLAVSVRGGLNLAVALAAVPFLVAFVVVEKAWARVRRVNAAVGTGGDGVEQLRARTEMTRDLAMYVALAATLAYFALVDTIGHAIYEAYARHNVAFSEAIAQLGAGLLALLPILRGAAVLFANREAQRPNPGLKARVFGNPIIAGVIAALIMLPPLVLVAYAAHAVFRGGSETALLRGGLLALAALGASVVLALPQAMPLVNRSSLQATYAARLARAYLGASNPRHGENDLDQVLPGDDVANLTEYKPHEAGGPLHLINCCVNQTVDRGTLRGALARQGVNMTCSPIGVSVGKYAHAVWDRRNGRTTVAAVGHVLGTPHPLLGADDQPPDTVQSLPLRDWMSISGAAFGTGLGQSNNPALSILFGLANLRTGYWWDSGLTASDRGTRPDVSFLRRLLWLLSTALPVQSRLIDEARGHFAGPWTRYWYLSDGGHFENLGGYEMVRRRVPFFVMLDAGADPDYDFDDFANFQRKARIDFGAEFEPFGQAAWDAATAADVAGCPPDQRASRTAFWAALAERVAVEPRKDGPFDQLLGRPPTSPPDAAPHTLQRHAFLMRIRYPHVDRTSVVLYVKASLDGDEPVDLKHYHVENPDFPHESTVEQSFNEAQWESYRRLGQHIGDEVFGPESAPGVLWLSRLACRREGGDQSGE